MTTPFLSIVIPAFNEKDRLPKTLEKLLQYLGQQAYIWEIIVVDDGSSDQTASLIEAEFKQQVIVIRQPRNLGKGAAVRAGVLATKGQQVLFSDADGSTPITELPKLQVKLSEGFDLAIGNRRDSALVLKQPFYRIVIGEGFNILARYALNTNIKDTQCGFKLLNGDIGRKLFSQMKMDGFSFDAELIHLANQNNFKIAEVPVIWIDDTRSKVKVWKDPILVFIDLVKIRLIHG